MNSFTLRADVCYCDASGALVCAENACLVCENGVSRGVFDELPREFSELPHMDFSGKLVLPGLVDLHVHAPQYASRALGLELELLGWLETHTFPCEARYSDLTYARASYAAFVDDLKRGPNTRACVYATVHRPATMLLMDMLEESGLVTMVGRVNMDRNSSADLQEAGAEQAARDTVAWIEECRYTNTTPILTPRFLPACSDRLMRLLKTIQEKYRLPVQSHMSENQSEIAWVRDLCPDAESYADAYLRYGLLGGGIPTVMAHCVWSGDAEIELMRRQGVFVAHCPQSNINLSSGIAPVRRFMNRGLSVGLGSDVAGGCHTSILRAMCDAIQVSKLRWRLLDQTEAPLTTAEAFYLGTMGGGSFFGKVGSFMPGYEFDAVVFDDGALSVPQTLTIEERLARVMYLSDDRHVVGKYVRGCKVL